MKKTLFTLLEKIEHSQEGEFLLDFVRLNDKLSISIYGGRASTNGNCSGSTNNECTNISCNDSSNTTCNNSTCFI